MRAVGPGSSVATHHTAALLEVLKGDEHRKPGSRIPFVQPVGEATYKGRTCRTVVSEWDVLQPGQELILFLSESERQPPGVLIIRAGPAGVYVVENGSVSCQGTLGAICRSSKARVECRQWNSLRNCVSCK